MSFYQYHLFFCVNQREDGGRCCQECNADALRSYAKKRCKELGIHGHGQVRINSAGCLNRCSEGPVVVVYPEETWYTYVDRADIDEIIDQHLLHGRPVKRLRLG
ncbi:MAG: (2Fe-2S) ferredoxin domain-containing protein [Gammaproteobacteria bacterium]|nr:(2Fe-2S) ferredoxin domain-containing protein [Gammaproteobacteria bacterium]